MMGTRSSGGLLITKVHQVSGRVFGRILKRHGVRDINPAQGRVLFALWDGDGVPIRQLADKTLLSKPTLTLMLDRMERSGMIAREPSGTDRREVIIRLTMKDCELKRLFRRVSAEMTGIFYRGFSGGEIERFEGFLERILGNLLDHENNREGTKPR
jgi:MarR family transcriptional regulator, organic hydroperoxide resistance regulator